MRILVVFTLFVLLVTSPEISRAEKVYRVVVYGDSITSGYQLQPQDSFPARLEKKILSNGYEGVTVINLSREDATTASATATTDQVLQTLPDVIIVQLGYNDARRGVLASAVAHNLKNIIIELKKSGAYIIVMGTPAPDGSADAYKNQIMNNYYEVSGNESVALYPSAVEGIAHNPALTLADGIHPNTAGVEMMVDGVFPLVDLGLRWRYEVYVQQQQQSLAAKPPGLPPVEPR